jgi:FtsP/CotA-like multicopper oxidase with cupredoxin domain
MPVPPVGRRQFLSAGGGMLFCTLAGHELSVNSHVDVGKLASQVEVPPRVAAAYAQDAERTALTLPPPLGGTTTTKPGTASGQTREYWIRAEKMKWNIVPTHHDGVKDRPVHGKVAFKAFGYRPYSANFAKPLGPATIPGPLIEAEIGDTVVINFRNETGVPVTMHPHGIFYSVDMDGAYKGKYTVPSGFVENKRTFRYVWEAREGTEGSWLYHDHGPLCPLPLFKGLFGPLIVRKPGDPVPDAEFFLFLHSFVPAATNLQNTFMCINGRAYAGNTPTLRAKVGQTVAFHVVALDDNFHTFHLHGHRWVDPDGGVVVDNRPLGPGDSMTASFVEDNPGRWLYHCHVFSHVMMGMIGWYIVSA